MEREAVDRLPEMADLWRETLEWQPDAHQQELFQQFYELILTSNRQFNLTRITAPSDFWEKHLWDSLRGIAPWLAQTSNLKTQTSKLLQAIDIGTGAGFPGVPIAIVHPTWTVTLLDSTRKKIGFIQNSVQALGIENVKTLVERVEQIGRDRHHREHYDVALIRAVSSASVCAEYALPLLKVGGFAVLYRGQWTEEEAQGLESAVAQLGGAIEACESFVTPLTQSQRHCLYLRKIAPTPPNFPRPVGIATQIPL
jgi:16S rRNA (guanine527-N7)-methyltransferase